MRHDGSSVRRRFRYKRLCSFADSTRPQSASPRLPRVVVGRPRTISRAMGAPDTPEDLPAPYHRRDFRRLTVCLRYRTRNGRNPPCNQGWTRSSPPTKRGAIAGGSGRFSASPRRSGWAAVPRTRKWRSGARFLTGALAAFSLPSDSRWGACPRLARSPYAVSDHLVAKFEREPPPSPI